MLAMNTRNASRANVNAPKAIATAMATAFATRMANVYVPQAIRWSVILALLKKSIAACVEQGISNA